ncbi:DUF6783 domain-containing protein [Enterocloster hominis]|uniref:DUF6783 domain-containing protein n=1 Tax=Enterocloster hominis (ex Hitch et al. 2024) TaxID=1917870 RepID=A0ABV1DG76_9FIRM
MMRLFRLGGDTGTGSGAREVSGDGIMDADRVLAAVPAVDAVYVKHPGHLTFQGARRLLSGGIHVIMEGISGFDRAQVLELQMEADDAGVVYTEAFKAAANPCLHGLKGEMHRLGRINRMTFMSCARTPRHECREEPADTLPAPDLAHGALVERGADCIFTMIACFGIPEQIQADPVFCENGMDIAGSVQGRYEGKRCKGAEAEILYSQVSASHVPSQIRGEKGSLVIRSIADPSELCFYGRDGEKEVLALRTSPVITDEEIRTWIARACLGIHSRHRYVPLRGISGPNPVNAARCASLIGTGFPTKWNARLTESNFQTRPGPKCGGCYGEWRQNVLMTHEVMDRIRSQVL